MTINGEEVELVTSFDQLRAGMTCVLTECVCGGTHRAMLTTQGEVSNGFRDAGTMGWMFVPAIHDDPFAVVTRGAIQKRRVYYVVNPLDAETTARKREAVRP